MNRETIAWEKNMQPYMDVWYQKKELGFIDRSRSCRKFDLMVGRWRIEEKFLFCGKEYDQFLIELIQDASTGDLGWFYHVDADALVWCYCQDDHISEPISIYWIDYKKLKIQVLDTLRSSKWQTVNICNEHYGVTINFPMKWKPLLDVKIATHYWYSPHIMQLPLYSYK